MHHHGAREGDGAPSGAREYTIVGRGKETVHYRRVREGVQSPGNLLVVVAKTKKRDMHSYHTQRDTEIYECMFEEVRFRRYDFSDISSEKTLSLSPHPLMMLLFIWRIMFHGQNIHRRNHESLPS